VQENGPSLWIDPQNNLFVQLDVRMPAENAAVRSRLCADIFKEIFRALGLSPAK
jgi:hypothetical protein